MQTSANGDYLPCGCLAQCQGHPAFGGIHYWGQAGLGGLPLGGPGALGGAVAPQGCICPPTAEKTCEGLNCPRKNPFKQAAQSGNPPSRVLP